MTNDTVQHATGTFEVTVKPTGHEPDPTLGSHSLDKRYTGGLEASGKGEMLSAGDLSAGNAGYVAMERVSGTLNGKEGTFAIMQMGSVVNASAPQMAISVVPGSGTGSLVGITGSMNVVISGGKHAYDLAYTVKAKE